MAEKYFLNLRHLASSITLPEKATPSGVKWINLAGQIVQWFHPAAKSAESSFAWHGFKTDKVGCYCAAHSISADSLRVTGPHGRLPRRKCGAPGLAGSGFRPTVSIGWREIPLERSTLRKCGLSLRVENPSAAVVPR